MPKTMTPRINRQPQPSPLPGYLTTAEIAARANLSQEHVGRLIRQGKLPAIRIGWQYLVKEEDWAKYDQEKKPWGMPRGPHEQESKQEPEDNPPRKHKRAAKS